MHPPSSPKPPPSREQKATVLTYEGTKDTRELNEYFSEGWKVVNTCPMPSSTGGGYFAPTCLVILERIKGN